MMKILTLIISFSLIIAPLPVLAQAAPEKIQKDVLQIGRASSLLPKEIVFDAGEGASNKKISLDPSDNEFDLNSTLNISGAMNSSSLNVSGSSTHEAGLTLGDGTTADRLITVDRGGSNPYLKWNETIDAWVYSNEGLIEKKIGSGSGGGGSGGVNLLQNASFEDGVGGNINNWTATGGTLTHESFTDSYEQDTKFARFVATTSGEKVCSDATVIPDNFNSSCFATINYFQGDNAFRMYAIDGSSNELGEVSFSDLTQKWMEHPYGIPFECPASGTSVQLCVESTGAGTIDLNLAHLGNDYRLSKSSTGTKTGSVSYEGIVNCVWTKVGAGFGSFPVDADCNSATSSGSIVEAPSTKVPSIIIKPNPAKVYDFFLSGRFRTSDSTTSSSCQWELYDGTNSYYLGLNRDANTGATSSQDDIPLLSTRIELSSPIATNTTFEIRASGSSGTASCLIQGDTSLKFSVTAHASDSQDVAAIRPDQSGWQIDASIGGANADLSTSAVTTYTEITNSGLDMVLNTGSAPAKIPCSSTNPATGLTCSAGSEGLGVVFTPPYTGSFDVCFYGSHNGNASSTATSGALTTFQLMRTANSSQTVLEEGKSKVMNRFYTNAAASSLNTSSIAHCGSFYFSDTSEKTIRLMYEQVASGTISTNQILADRDASSGQRDVRITVRPSTMNVGRPVIVENYVHLSAEGFVDATISATTEDIGWSDVVRNLGGGSWDGARYTIPSAGVYNIKFALSCSAGASFRPILTVNGTTYRFSGTFESFAFKEGGWTEYFNANDVVSIRLGSLGCTLNGSDSQHYLTISKIPGK